MSNHVFRNAAPPIANDGLTPGAQVVRGLGERRQLGVPVADVEDRDLAEVLGALDDVVEDRAAGVLRARDAHQERERRRDVDLRGGP